MLTCAECGTESPEGTVFCGRCGRVFGDTPSGEKSIAGVKVGDVLSGRYRLESKLGEGGMGTVWVAHDQELDRKVALKLLAKALVEDAEVVERFEREGRLTAKLDHPNIVPIYDVGRHEGRPFLVMKRLEGETLANRLKTKGGLTKDETLELFAQLAKGIDFIHERGFIHRDIKAQNIVVGPDGHATLLDFGIVRPTRGGEVLTRAGMVMGTPHYMAPEQALGLTDIDHRADLYALAVVLFECLTGTLPFEGDSELQIIQLQAHAPPPGVLERAPWVPAPVAEVMGRALAKRPLDRYSSAAGLITALQQAYADAEPVAPRFTPPGAPVPAPPPSAPKPPPSEPPQGIPEGTAPGWRARAHAAQQVSAQLDPGSSTVVVSPELTEGAPTETPVAEQGPVPGADEGPVEGPKLAGVAAVEAGMAQVQSAQRRSNPIDLIALLPPKPTESFLAEAAAVTLNPEDLENAVKPNRTPWVVLAGVVTLALFGSVVALAISSKGTTVEPPPAEPIRPTADAVDPLADAGAVTPLAVVPPVAPAPVVPDAGTLAQAPVPPPPAPPKVPKGKLGVLRVVTTKAGEPYWAQVFVDGIPSGRTPVTLKVAIGRHLVRVERPGFAPQEREVKVVKRGSPLRIELKPAE